jgi:hypothetical protein
MSCSIEVCLGRAALHEPIEVGLGRSDYLWGRSKIAAVLWDQLRREKYTTQFWPRTIQRRRIGSLLI